MTSLVACLTTGKGSWAHVSRLISQQQWDKVYLITEEFGTKFQAGRNVEFVIIKTSKSVQEISKDIQMQLKDKITDLEVAVNLVSGEGKEHMALISALTRLGLGIRFVVAGERELEEV
ncbi:hypothetical protein HYV81_04905 [Candidatus Woesearchaeota archaeon]|nr:hypothetical protein [Candidatus Woesearchaeota archaeon]